MTEETEHKPVDTHNQILSAMYQLVAEGGLEKASINKICKIVDITPPAVYYYFDSKVEIFIEMLRNMASMPDVRDIFTSEEINNADAYRLMFEKYGTDVIEGYHDDLSRCLVLVESNIQARRIPEVYEWQLERVGTMTGALKRIIAFGVENGYLSNSINQEGSAELLYVVLRGISETMANREPIDAYRVWIQAIDDLVFAHAN